MPAKLGDHLGAVNSVETLRMRCYCPEHDDCWHLRSARGKPMQIGVVHQINVYSKGKITIGRAVWFLLKGEMPKSDRVVYRTCESYDCANPAHFKCGRREAALRQAAKNGYSAAKLVPLIEATRRRTKATAEVRKWIFESPLKAAEIAQQLGLSAGRVNAIRREMAAKPVTSVFQMGARLGIKEMRKAA